ncbi:MAG: type I 3-dehydroquinate dehydratase [Spirochaetaceae bacterium]|nr:type I 3-dehydroquinate dehydratase [Spirochaetaceae bacterium]
MPLVCLSLTGRTIAEDLAVLDLYRGQVDVAELRADYLDPSEKFLIRSFPERAGLPCALAIRRRADGGVFEEGEGVRLVMIAKGLAYAGTDSLSNFAYVDLEADFHIPAVEEACRAFGTRVIRSVHAPHGLPADLDALWDSISESPEEIPKLSLACRSAAELSRLFSWAAGLPDRERIVSGMGDHGVPSRILAAKTGSLIAYTSPLGAGLPHAAPGHLDPEVLAKVYRFREIGPDTLVFALTGGRSVVGSRSPALHNAAFRAAGIDAVYLPVPAETPAAFLELAETLGIRGAAITVPHKEGFPPLVASLSPDAREIGACNTLVRGEAGWEGHNTDAAGFERALREFLERRDLGGLRATIVGAGGAAKAVAYALARAGATCLVVNRGYAKAKALARTYGFQAAPSDERAAELVADHADLIVNATSVGMDGGPEGDPLDWYEFTGREAVFDLIYRPERTALLLRAKASGARISNGWAMLRYQAAEQFRVWTGREPPSSYYE